MHYPIKFPEHKPKYWKKPGSCFILLTLVKDDTDGILYISFYHFINTVIRIKIYIF